MKKTINTLADAFKLADQSLLKLEKYKVLLYSEKHEVPKYNNKLTCTKTQVITAKVNFQIDTQPARLIRHSPI